MSTPEVYYWEKMSSPHKAGLLEALSRRGYKVTYVVEGNITSDRLSQGWSAPSLEGVRLELVSSIVDVDRFIQKASPEAIHICDGIRSNGMVVYARAALKRHGLRFWVFMETVDDQGWRGVIKRLEYRRLFWLWRNQLAGVLCAGLKTTQWVIARGVFSEIVYPFAYFLIEPVTKNIEIYKDPLFYKFIFVGQFIERKRVDLLIDALASLMESENFELIMVGSGSFEGVLRKQADKLLNDRVTWVGKLPLREVSAAMLKADCLVLPSRHDGWGAVISESLMVGTPAICSEQCGAAVAVAASGYGGIFESGDVKSLSAQLHVALSVGRLASSQRARLAEWAQCLGAEAGADYLINIVKHKPGSPKPQPPWQLSDLSASSEAGHSLINRSSSSQV
jgi:glycosyltransferase involved in cell wall biosynthesis